MSVSQQSYGEGRVTLWTKICLICLTCIFLDCGRKVLRSHHAVMMTAQQLDETFINETSYLTVSGLHFSYV